MDSFKITENLLEIDFVSIHSLLSKSYWSPGISLETVKKGAQHSSLVVGALDSLTGKTIGYTRVLSDTTRFAYLADVIVDPDFRKRGIAQAILDYCLNHKKFLEVGKWFLITKDAQKLYEKKGFEIFDKPEEFMILKKRS